jgi:hypothetical protein
MANMDQFLMNKWTGYDYGAAFSSIPGCPSNYTSGIAYFFLRRELSEVTDMNTFRAAQLAGRVRHCKPYNGRWLDYTARKEFNTLAEWVADAGDTMQNVLYGMNRVHKQDYVETLKARKYVPQTPRYVSLQHLLDYLGYVAPLSVEVPEYKAYDRFSDILEKLGSANVPPLPPTTKCLVKRPDDTLVISEVIVSVSSELGKTVKEVSIAVPEGSRYHLKSYDRLSDMPAGMDVYFRTNDGSFKVVDELLSERQV